MGQRVVRDESLPSTIDDFLALMEPTKNKSNEPLDPIYKVPPVSFMEFLESPHYLDLAAGTYAYWKDLGEQVFTKAEGGGYLDYIYRDVIVEAGIGSGKSWAAVYFAHYLCYLLCCLPDPIAFLKYQRGETIVFLNMSKTEEHAKDQVFDRISSLFKKSPFWKLYADYYKIQLQKLSIDLPDKNIKFICGNSKPTRALGYCLFFAALDECNFYMDQGGHSVADDTWDNMTTRVTSRNETKGLVMGMSSNMDSNAFTTRKRRMKRDKTVPRLLAVNAPVWEIKENFAADTFVYEYKGFDSYGEKRVEEVWHVPIAYQEYFETTPEKACMDFGGRPSEKIGAFIQNWESFLKIFQHEWPDPVRDRMEDKLFFQPWFRARSDWLYYIHFDIGIKKDFCGVCMGHTERVTHGPYIGEPKFVVDLVTYLRKNEYETELQFSSIHALVYDLAELGFQMRLTFDGQLSMETRQTLKNRGFDVDYFSVDRSREPYDNWHTMMLAGKIESYVPMMSLKKGQEPVNILIDEAVTLKNVKLGKHQKVDHVGADSRKDAFDALAAASYKSISDPVSECTFEMI